jgi:sn-glycerol 3-phosphate transport system permease protein
VLILGVVVVAFPLYVTFVAQHADARADHAGADALLPGDQFWENYTQVLGAGTHSGSKAPVAPMMVNSLVMALVIAIGKIASRMLSAFAIVYFRFPLRRMFFFWMIFVTLMLPVEVRIIPTYKVVSDLGMLNSYAGLTMPLIASRPPPPSCSASSS